MRTNTVLIVLVGSAVLGLLMAAASKDATRKMPLANATRPQLTPATVVIATSTSTTVAGDLVAAGMASPADLFGLSSTTSSSVAVAATVPQPVRASTPAPTPATTATTAGASRTTVANPDVVYSDAPVSTSTTPTTTTPVVTTAPASTTTTTMTPTTPPPTTTPTTATTATTRPLGLPPLLGP